MAFRTYVLILAGVSVLYGVFFSSSLSSLHRVQAVSVPTNIFVSICGDGIANAGEVCDTGFALNNGSYGSSTAERRCNADCTAYGPYCGDGILQVRFSEQCDDGNNTSGDLCSAACIPEVPAAPPFVPNRGSIPSSGGPVGAIASEIETKVVLRGKAFPNANLNVLLDGEVIGTVRTDANADFLFTTSAVTPGTATFGFSGTDRTGVQSITSSVIFEVVQSAVTTVANILIPPTTALSAQQVAPGELLTIRGESVPNSSVKADINAQTPASFSANVAQDGSWSLQVDTNSLGVGFHAVKSLVELNATTKSGFGRALNFYVGTEPLASIVSPDTNDDGRVNLVDFSIFLLSWNTDDIRHDFNQDGRVNLADFSILLFNWTG